GAALVPCATPESYSGLADGSHTFSVQATDLAGNTGDAVTSTWTVDTTPPAVSLTAQPASLVSATAASFSFDASESASFACSLVNKAAASFSFGASEPSSLACSLDGAAFAPCTSPAGYSGLADGSHTFAVQATDGAGNTGASTTALWTVDTTPPTASIAKAPT